MWGGPSTPPYYVVSFLGSKFYLQWSLSFCIQCLVLTHWGRVTHICVSKLTVIGPVNGLLPGRRQAIIWTNAGILLIGPLRTNFNEIFIEIHTFSFKKIHLTMSSGKCRSFCLGPNVLIDHIMIGQHSVTLWPLSVHIAQVKHRNITLFIQIRVIVAIKQPYMFKELYT